MGDGRIFLITAAPLSLRNAYRKNLISAGSISLDRPFNDLIRRWSKIILTGIYARSFEILTSYGTEKCSVEVYSICTLSRYGTVCVLFMFS
jgi:hypothetical protein